MQAVASFYDRNTRWFVRFGRGTGAAGAIHRELWAPGVTTTLEAVNYAHELVSASVAGRTDPRLLDLGCGVGGSLCWLLDRHGGSGTGVTLSGAQVELARERAGDRRATFLQADYTALPPLAPVDVAFGIESFLHCADPDAMLAGVARVLVPGGDLVLIDDFLAPDVPPEADRILQRFRAGWHAPRLGTLQDLVDRAKPWFALRSDRDLTDLCHIRRPRDRAIHVAVALLGWAPIRHPYWSMLMGGDALQTALFHRWITYRHVVLRRSADV